MFEPIALAAFGLGVISVLLLLILLLRKNPVEWPADLTVRLGLVEASLQALNQSSARNEAGNERTQAQLREFTAQAMQSHEALRKILDDKLEKTVEESRKGRAELTTAFGTLEAKLEQRLGGFEGSMSGRVDALALATTSTLDALKKDIVGQLGVMSGALKDQLVGNGNQMRNQFSTLQDAVAQQLQGMAQGSQHNSEQLRTALNERLAAIQADNTHKLEEKIGRASCRERV